MCSKYGKSGLLGGDNRYTEPDRGVWFRNGKVWGGNLVIQRAGAAGGKWIC